MKEVYTTSKAYTKEVKSIGKVTQNHSGLMIKKAMHAIVEMMNINQNFLVSLEVFSVFIIIFILI